MDQDKEPTLANVLAAITGLREEFDQYRLRTTPLSETLEAFRVEVRERFDGFEKRLDGFEKRLDGFEKRLDGFEKRLDGFEKRLDGFGMELGVFGARLTAVEQELKDINRSNRRIEHKIDGISIELAERKGTLHDHEERLMRIEG
jgi:predicted  nucleic acid-binding Zn-ribbon protein